MNRTFGDVTTRLRYTQVNTQLIIKCQLRSITNVILLHGYNIGQSLALQERSISSDCCMCIAAVVGSEDDGGDQETDRSDTEYTNCSFESGGLIFGLIVGVRAHDGMIIGCFSDERIKIRCC